MSALTQQPVRVHNVRGGTRKPGITSEDLTFVRGLEASCGASLTGDDLRNGDLTFEPAHAPRPIRTRLDMYEHEKGTIPGNALIVASSLLPVLARSGGMSRLIVTGETYNPNTLVYDVFERQTLSALRQMGVYAFPHLELAGFGYGGKGEVSLEVEPSLPSGLIWKDRGKLHRVQVVIAYCDLQPSIAERGVDACKVALEPLGCPIDAEATTVAGHAPGIFVSILGEAERGLGCGTAMGARGIRIETVVESAVAQFREWVQSDASADPFLADHLLIPAALSSEPTEFSVSRVTRRLQTIAAVIKQFLPIHLTVLGMEGEPGVIKVSR